MALGVSVIGGKEAKEMKRGKGESQPLLGRMISLESAFAIQGKLPLHCMLHHCFEPMNRDFPETLRKIRSPRFALTQNHPLRYLIAIFRGKATWPKIAKGRKLLVH